MAKPWTVQDAQAHLSEIVRRARGGAPQRIGCDVVAERAWRERSAAGHGTRLVASAPRREPLPAAERTSRRSVPFADGEADGAPEERALAHRTR